MTMVVRPSVTGPDQVLLVAKTPKCHAADKHDTPPSHLSPTLGQPALL